MRCRLRSGTMRNVASVPFVAIAILAFGRANADDPLSPKEAKAILEKVVRAVATNRAQLTDVRAEIVAFIECRSVDKPKKTVVHTKEGVTLTTYASPHNTSRETIAISGDRLRYDVTGGSAFEDLNRDETWIVKPGQWQHYRPGPPKPGWLRTWSKLIERPQIDPRDYGCGDMRMEFQQWLEALEAQSAQLVRLSDGTMLARIQARHGNGYELECSSRYEFLPSFVVTLYENRIISSEEITYQPVLNGKAWFPKTRILRSFQDGAPHGPRSNDCPLIMKWFVTRLDVQSSGKPRPIPALEVQPGTRIQDMTALGD
jgi:hypothetical protein